MQQQADAVKKAQQDLENSRNDAQQEVSNMQSDLKLAQRQAQMEIDLERKKLEQYKQFALREIEFARQQADKQQQLNAAFQQEQTDMKVKSKEHSLQLKHSALAEQTKQQQATQKAETGPTMSKLDELSQLLKEMSKPKTARKQPDGSWTTA